MWVVRLQRVKRNAISVGSSPTFLQNLWRILSDMAYESRPGQFCYPFVARYSDSLEAVRSGDRIHVGAILCVSVQTAPGEEHTTSCTIGIESFWWRQSGRGLALNTHPPSSAKVKERIELYLYSISGPLWPVLSRKFSSQFIELYQPCIVTQPKAVSTGFLDSSPGLNPYRANVENMVSS
jgi:hypothetical protein